jgi:hypothetical protein
MSAPHAADPDLPLLAIDLLVAGVLLMCTRQERLALAQDLGPLARHHPRLLAAVGVLVQEHPHLEEWHSYKHAVAAIEAWLARHNGTGRR